MSANIESPDRMSRVWWIIEQGEVRTVTGFEAKHHYQKGMWWCPEIGFTLTEHYDLFETEEAALRKLIGDLKVEISGRTKLLSAAEQRLKEIQEGTK